MGDLSQVNVGANESISKFIQEPILVPVTESVQNAAHRMAQRKAGCVVVTSNGDPIGIVTEWDILSRVVAEGKDASQTQVRQVMSAPVQSVSPQTKVGDALSMMVKKGIRRLVVKEGDRLVGIVTLTQVVGSRKEETVTLPLLEPSKGSRCPYCGSILKDREELSRHIDDVHIREEVLRGIHSTVF